MFKMTTTSNIPLEGILHHTNVRGKLTAHSSIISRFLWPSTYSLLTARSIRFQSLHTKQWNLEMILCHHTCVKTTQMTEVNNLNHLHSGHGAVCVRFPLLTPQNTMNTGFTYQFHKNFALQTLETVWRPVTLLQYFHHQLLSRSS
jgi:hypothetical protein